VKQDVDIGREVSVENGGLDEPDVPTQILGCSEIAVVDGDDSVRVGEMVREIRSNEAGATRDENAFILHASSYW
jgi:hypothetical protein